MAKSKNPWLAHLKKIRAENPKVKSVAALAKIAKKSYKPKK